MDFTQFGFTELTKQEIPVYQDSSLGKLVSDLCQHLIPFLSDVFFCFIAMLDYSV